MAVVRGYSPLRDLSPTPFPRAQVCRQLVPPPGYVTTGPCSGQQHLTWRPLQGVPSAQHPMGTPSAPAKPATPTPGTGRSTATPTPGRSTATPTPASSPPVSASPPVSSPHTASPHAALSARSAHAPSSSCGTPSPRLTSRLLVSPDGVMRVMPTPKTPPRGTRGWPHHQPTAAERGFQWQPAAAEAAAVLSAAESVGSFHRPAISGAGSDGTASEALLTGVRTPSLSARTPTAFTPAPPLSNVLPTVHQHNCVSRSVTPAPIVQRQESLGRVITLQRQVSYQKPATPAKAVNQPDLQRAPTPAKAAVNQPDLRTLPKFQPPMWHVQSLPVPESPDATPLNVEQSTPHTLEENRSLLSSLWPNDLESANHEQRNFSQWPQPDEVAADDNKENENRVRNFPAATPSSVCSYSTSSEPSVPRADEDFDVQPLEACESKTSDAELPTSEAPEYELFQNEPLGDDLSITPPVTGPIATKEAMENAYMRGPGRSSTQADDLVRTSLVFPQVVLGAVLAEPAASPESSVTTVADPPSAPTLSQPLSQRSSTTSDRDGDLFAVPIISPTLASVADSAPSPNAVPQPTRLGALTAVLQVSQLTANSKAAPGLAAGRDSFSGFSWPAELCPEEDESEDTSKQQSFTDESFQTLKQRSVIDELGDTAKQYSLTSIVSRTSSPVRVDCGSPTAVDCGFPTPVDIPQADDDRVLRLRSAELCTPGTQGSTGGTGGFCYPSPCTPATGGDDVAEVQHVEAAEFVPYKLGNSPCHSGEVQFPEKNRKRSSYQKEDVQFPEMSRRSPHARCHDFAFPEFDSPSPQPSPVETFLARIS